MWQSYGYESAKIAYLPLEEEIKGRRFILNYLNQSELSDVYRIVCDGVKDEDNIGTEEYLDQDDFEEKHAHFEAFSVKENDTFLGAIFIGPNMMCRSIASCVCQFNIYIKHELFKGGFHRELVKIGERLAIDLKLRYFVSSVLVFGSNSDIIVDLRADGYSTNCCLPYCGKTKSRGYQQTFVLTKQIGKEVDIRPLIDIFQSVRRAYVGFKPDENPNRSDILPRTHIFKSGQVCNLRWLKQKEYRVFHKIFTSAMKSGIGFSVDECLNYEMFVMYQINGKYTMVIEDAESHRILGVATGGCVKNYRGVTPFMAEASIVLAPHTQGKGLATELVDIFPAILKAQGYQFLLGDAEITSERMRFIEFNSGYHTIGVIPYSIYLAGKGWRDTVLSVRDLRAHKNLDDLIKSPHETADKHKL